MSWEELTDETKNKGIRKTVGKTHQARCKRCAAFDFVFYLNGSFYHWIDCQHDAALDAAKSYAAKNRAEHRTCRYYRFRWDAVAVAFGLYA